MQVQPQVAFRGGLAAAMFCPVDAGGHELNGGGIDHMDDTLEASGQTLAALALCKAGLETLEMREHRPE